VGVTIVIADDHPIVLMGLRSVFALERDFQLLATCVDGEEALNALQRHKPDVLVLDLNLPRLDGLGVLRAIRERGIDVAVIMLTAALTPAEAQAALSLGAKGLLLKAHAPQQLVQCVRTVRMGGWWLPESGVSGPRWTPPQPVVRSVSQLTHRERVIAELVAKGHRNKEIADSLSITEGTVKVHLGNIYKKLAVSNRVGLALHLRDEGT
jgi:DNA-binding NarL/FixJ family response regulator